MAKSKASAKSSSASLEKRTSNRLVQQFYDLRAEIRKVTWPTRQEARALTTAVSISMIVMAIFLYAVDALFQAIVGGVISLNLFAIIGALVAIALLGLAFYANSRET